MRNHILCGHNIKRVSVGAQLQNPYISLIFLNIFTIGLWVTHEPKCSPSPFLFCDLYATSLQTETAVYEEVGTHRKSSQRFQISL